MSTISIQAGLNKEILKVGNGQQVKRNDRITVHCTGYLDKNPLKKFWRYVH